MATQPIFVDCWLDFFDKIAEVRGKTYRQHYENLLEHPNSSVSQHALARAEEALRKAPTFFKDEDLRELQRKIEEDLSKSPPDESDTPLE